MTALLMLAFMFAVYGFFNLFNINIIEIADDFISASENSTKSIQSVIIAANAGARRKGFLSKIQVFFAETKRILAATNRTGFFTTLCVISVALLFIGFAIGIICNNPFLSLVLAGGLAVIPFWLVKLSENNYQNNLNDELETALSVITTSYIRNNNISKAIEENMHHINPPVQDVFERFLVETKYISSSIPDALLRLSTRINNVIFEEWCLELIACQDNRNLKYTLPDIVGKFGNVRMINGTMGVDIYEPLRELLITSGILLCFPIMIYFLNADWFSILINTWVGKLTLACQILVVFIGINAGIRITKPIAYER
ncbi:hypothetical protein LNN31_08335 [Acetobacterium wieringae]|uniref:Reverse transcriptase domain-containing protein n=1 Tax=Acetobacterium wieringae TaxID=52694 RepID=A0ABY6HIP7_9FIRM|nr:hypothetical protein [Acetobacterium wieringae]UYO64416.1 hypothetical protein LNN31_08335 [Acetobacterium wieringae]VUZ25208.1 Uncharacterised protein [Acetobacterium wieringae]